MSTLPDPNVQEARENPEPQESHNPMPWVVILLTAALFVFGIVYILRSDLTTPPAWGDGRALAELQGAPSSAGAAGSVDGAAVYSARCAACHQANGAGLPGVFPPLAGSEWVSGKDNTLIAAVLHGIDGPLTVKGQSYNGVMPAFAAQLNDAEVAALLTHIRSQWGNSAAPIGAEAVATVRSATEGQSGPYHGDAELNAIP